MTSTTIAVGDARLQRAFCDERSDRCAARSGAVLCELDPEEQPVVLGGRRSNGLVACAPPSVSSDVPVAPAPVARRALVSTSAGYRTTSRSITIWTSSLGLYGRCQGDSVGVPSAWRHRSVDVLGGAADPGRCGTGGQLRAGAPFDARESRDRATERMATVATGGVQDVASSAPVFDGCYARDDVHDREHDRDRHRLMRGVALALHPSRRSGTNDIARDAEGDPPVGADWNPQPDARLCATMANTMTAIQRARRSRPAALTNRVRREPSGASGTTRR